MFFKKPEKKVVLEYEAYPASGVDFEESSSESYTNNLPNHTVLSRNTWEYEKMEDVPFPIGEDWEWIDCYKALYKVYYHTNKEVKYIGPSRNFAYELNRIYSLPEGEEEFSKVDYCGNGFHACLNLTDVFTYYGGIIGKDIVVHEVELEYISDEMDDDSKVVSKKITIGKRIL